MFVRLQITGLVQHTREGPAFLKGPRVSCGVQKGLTGSLGGNELRRGTAQILKIGYNGEESLGIKKRLRENNALINLVWRVGRTGGISELRRPR